MFFSEISKNGILRAIVVLMVVCISLNSQIQAQKDFKHMGPQESGDFRKVVLLSDTKDEKGNLVDSLVDPMEMDIASDGTVYVAERRGTVKAIDPKTGKVVQQISANKLTNQSKGNGDVLNGIAYNPETQKMILTGKYWTKYLEVKVVPVK